MNTGAFGEHPAGKDAFLIAVKLDLVDLDEHRGPWALRRLAGVTGARRDL